MKLYRQGDVLFKQVKSIPSGNRKVRTTGHILEGETSGHIHRVKESDLAIAEVFEIDDRLFLSATEDGISILHEDHKTVTLPAGDYEVIRQREYSPEEIRNVAD